MKPKFICGKWYIEVHTEILGDVLLLDKSGLPIPLEFDTKDEAIEYINSNGPVVDDSISKRLQSFKKDI